MAETSREGPSDQKTQQAPDRDPGSPNQHNELQASAPDQPPDVQSADLPTHNEEVSGRVLDLPRDEGDLHSPCQHPVQLDQHQGGHSVEQNKSYLERPDDLSHYVDDHPVQGQTRADQQQHQGSVHDSDKEALHCERFKMDQDGFQHQDRLSRLNWSQDQDLDGLHHPEHKGHVNIEAKDPTRPSSGPDPLHDQLVVLCADQDPVPDRHAQGLALHQDISQHSDSPQEDIQDLNLNLHAHQDIQLPQPGSSCLLQSTSYFDTRDQVQGQPSPADLAAERDSCFSVDQSSPQGPDEADHRHSLQQTLFNPEQDLTSDTACKDEAEESGGSIPSLVITQAEESQRPAFAQPVALPVSPTEKTEVQIPERPTDLEIPAVACTPTDPSPSSSDGGDMICCDLLSLKSDSISLASEAAISRRSEEGQEEDTRSVTASSVMSLFHRVQMDPLEKAWLRSSALGNISAQHQLLAQDPSLALKKTALHWAAKQGRLEAVDMMLSSGVDVNVRSGYTALHLASIQGHLHVVQALLNTYHAKINIRDYHGKTAVHYWNGSMDVFNKCGSQSGERLSRGRLTQRYTLPSLLLSRSRSQGQLNLDFGTMSHSPHHDVFNLQI